ncbi:MAG TPA: Ig-like domain repeat protein, partial [Tepidisphaeraceae bacterium]|nr:Ig-like domain repeat protein [Tepidisphaeraceae bacterium]
EQVVISGADPISNWSSFRGAIYQASASWNLGDGQNQLFFDGQMMTEARWPNTSLDVSHPTFATATSSSAQVKAVGPSIATIGTTLNDPAGAWVGATIHFSPGPEWVVQSGTVIASSPGSLTFQYQPGTPEEVPTDGNEFYLTGLFRGLDSAGEWYLDNSGKLSFQAPQNVSPAGHDVELKHRQYAFDLSGRSNIHISGLGIFACTINTDANSTNNGLQGITARYISQATINPSPWDDQYHPHTTGIILNGSNNVIQDSTIDYSSGDGVFLGGSNNTVQNCVIANVDYAGGDEAGVSTLGGNEHVVGNTIFNAARRGIVIRFSPFDQVLHNVVHDVGLQLTDLGGIYTWGTDGHGSEIAYNEVYNVHTGGYGAAGIYLDNYSANYVVDHNVVWNCDFGLKLNPPSNENVIYNNTFIGTENSIASSGNEDMTGTLLANNILMGAAQIGPGARQIHNLYTPPDPRFVNPAAGDFQLQSTSPAIDAGSTLPPFLTTYAGNAPDIGAYEYDTGAFAAGAGVSPPSATGNPLAIPAQPPSPPQASSGSASGGQQSGSTGSGSTGSTSKGGSSSGSGGTQQSGSGSGSPSGSGSGSGGTREKPPTTDPAPPPASPPPVQTPPPTSVQTGTGPALPTASGGATDSSAPTVTSAPLAATSVLLTSSENPALSGDSLQITAHVLAPVAPEGTVTFYDGSNLLGSLPLTASGSATLAANPFAVGTHTISARFDPAAAESTLAPSTSAPLLEVIGALSPGQPDVTADVLGVPKASRHMISQFGRPTSGRVRIRLTNTGSGTSSGAVRIDLYLSADEGLDSGDVFVSSLTRHLRLRPHRTVTLTVPLRRYPTSPPAGTTAQPGTYYMLAQVSGLQSPTRLLSSNTIVNVQTTQPHASRRH